MNARHLDPDTRPDDADPAITILRGDPTPEELAAITAVLTAMAQEAVDDAMPAAPPTRSAWPLSTRFVRPPLYPGHGVWRGFSG